MLGSLWTCTSVEKSLRCRSPRSQVRLPLESRDPDGGGCRGDVRPPFPTAQGPRAGMDGDQGSSFCYPSRTNGGIPEQLLRDGNCNPRNGIAWGWPTKGMGCGSKISYVFHLVSQRILGPPTPFLKRGKIILLATL